MVMTWRTTDLLRWGVGNGGDLTEEQVDENFWTHEVRIVALEEELGFATVSIDDFDVVGDQLTIIMTDYTTRGPYTLPSTQFTARGEWLELTEYFVMDLVTINGAVYSVNIAHTSEATFDAGLQIGGEDVYGLMFEAPQNSLPAGGAAGMILVKSTSADYDVSWSFSPVPTGGTTGQRLVKASDDDFDTEWEDNTLGGLEDVSLGALAEGHVLVYRASDDAFFNEPATVSLLSDVDLSDLRHRQVLRYDEPSETWIAETAAPPVTHVTSTLTLDTDHLERLVKFTGECAITVPLASTFGGALAPGHTIHLRQSSSGGLAITGDSGVLISGIDGFMNATDRRGAVAVLCYAGGDAWDLWGLLAPEAES